MSTGSEMLLERLRAATADEYDIQRQIGLGGMAAVFLARDIALDRQVAIKVMRPDLDVAGIQDRFVIEARTAANLDHPGIVSVYAVGQRAGLLFIVMKYIEGRTLEAVLRAHGRLDATTAAEIGQRVAETLHFAHGEGVVHRDVKPSNIMIDTRGRPVVTDFGIARVMTAESITVAGSMLGTPTHMSPEQCRGLPATAASDQYSLGITLYEMLAGRVPFTGTLFEVLDAHRSEAPPPLSRFASIDPALEETVMRMLAKDPRERWPSLADVAGRLTAIADAAPRDVVSATLVFLGAPAPEPAPSEPPPPPAPPPASVLPAAAPIAAVPAVHPGVAEIPATPEPVALGGIGMAPAPPGGAGVAERGAPTAPPHAAKRWLTLGAGAALLLAVAAGALWRARDPVRTPPPAPADSTTRVNATVAPPVGGAHAAPAPDSTPDPDSTSDPDSTPAAPPTAPSSPPPLPPSSSGAAATVEPTQTPSRPGPTTVPARARPDSPRTVRARNDSLAQECARLLERVSLGEKLTEAESARLRRGCEK